MAEPFEHTRHRNWLETILRYIPGFRGYLEKEYRRDSDDLQRRWLIHRLDTCRLSLDNLTGLIVETCNIDVLPKVDTVRAKIDHLSARIGGAMEGYSGFFDLVRIDNDVLDRIYQHDISLMAKVDHLANLVEELPQCPADLTRALHEVERGLDDLQRHWDERTKILEGID
ncbi:MAG: hypothetical protein ACUVTW_01520 [Thermogutta sp.]